MGGGMIRARTPDETAGLRHLSPMRFWLRERSHPRQVVSPET
jgi:hypothetical protein